MAIGTILSHIGKNRIGVALPAGHTIVHAVERIASLIVIEIGRRTNRRPTGSQMAILARSLERAVGTERGFPLRGRGNIQRQQRKQQPPQDSYEFILHR
jgi:hypothetical protein